VIKAFYKTITVPWLFATTLLALTFGCEKPALTSCIRMEELGSKSQPFRIAFTGENKIASELNLVQAEKPSFSKLKECFEKTAGLSVSFEFLESEQAILDGLNDERFHFGVVNSLSYGISSSYLFQNILLVSYPEKERLARSVLLGLSESWKTSFEVFSSDKVRIGYESPESDFGFLIPRHLLFMQKFFPQESLFAWSPEALVNELDKKNVDMIALSSDFLFEKFSESLGQGFFNAILPGMRFDRFAVFLTSPSIPKKSFVASPNIIPKIKEKVRTVFPECVLLLPPLFSENVFGAQALSVPRVRDFELIEEMSASLKNFPQLNPFFGRE
jgi:ABC-type phosphate/phosphonate transport system substrate-binding protein